MTTYIVPIRSGRAIIQIDARAPLCQEDFDGLLEYLTIMKRERIRAVAQLSAIDQETAAPEPGKTSSPPSPETGS